MDSSKDVLQAVENQDDHPVKLTSVGGQISDAIDDITEGLNQCFKNGLNLEIEEREKESSVSSMATSPLPTTSKRQFPSSSTNEPIFPKKIRQIKRWDFEPIRPNLDSPPASPEKLVFSSELLTASRQISTHQTPMRRKRISRINSSNICPPAIPCNSTTVEKSKSPFFLDPSTPEKAASKCTPQAPERLRKNFNVDRRKIEARKISPDSSPEPPRKRAVRAEAVIDLRASTPEPMASLLEVFNELQLTPGGPRRRTENAGRTPLRRKKTAIRMRSVVKPNRFRFNSPPSSPPRSVHPMPRICHTPVVNAPRAVPQAPVQPARATRFDHITLKPTRLSFDSPSSSRGIPAPIRSRRNRHAKRPMVRFCPSKPDNSAQLQKVSTVSNDSATTGSQSSASSPRVPSRQSAILSDLCDFA